MSSILDARKEFLSVLRSTGFAPELKRALIEWSYGRPRMLNNKYPGLAISLRQSFEFHFVTFHLIKCLSTDSIERAAEAIEDESQPVLIAEKNPKSADRHFDIVDNFSELLRQEKSVKKCKLITSSRDFIKNRKDSNKQCIIGFACVMFRNNIFKKACYLKRGSKKTITLQDVLKYFQDRYNFGSLETGRKDLDHCIEMALDRIPGLREFDDNNYQKKQQSIKRPKS